MNQSDGSKITIFHLYRKDGRALFLHPFDDAEVVLSLDKMKEICGKYGQEPRVESLTLFRDDLHQAVDSAVLSWIQDRRFIPNLFYSAGVFLALYFIFSFGIRDPILMVDELILAVAGTAGFYWYRLRRDRARPQAVNLTDKLKTMVDKIEFREDSFVKEVEGLLHRFESISGERLLESMMASEEGSFSSSDLEDAQQLLSYLEKRFSGKIYRQQEKIIDQYSSTAKTSRSLNTLLSLVDMGKIDISLFMTYKTIKKECREMV